MMAGIETNLFEGSSAGKTLKYSIMDYQNDNFKIAGEVIAVSIAQDGPPPNFFHEWSYTFISMGEFDKDQLSETDVTDPELLDLISKVETSDKAALIDLLERILACGYMGPVTCDKKASIVSAIVLHSRVRVLPMLQQICTGLKLYGLHDMIKQNPAIFQPLFVPGHLDKPDADFLVMALSPLLSEPGSLKRHKELRIVNFLQDFIQSMDDEEEPTDALEQETAEQDQAEGKGDNQNSFTVCGMLQWLTGQAHVPITAAERAKFKITVEFEHDCQTRYGQHGVCYPVVNACSNSIRFPTLHIGTYPEFVHIMKQALINSKEFGRC
ncbi:uncharacterized protein LOC111190324 [Astyanax mexicanus]|uniref:uncharacterized protein LOC111190324 n=1 Tax=Astyanax mexicanus TaxID=7994 RepID=UPI0020CB5447|nr:uncharacterized protein LOC111190324 [Astyanax mexicanus]